MLIIKPPTNVPTKADGATKTGPAFISDGAPDQIFRFERWGFSYGTDDKSHAAAIILSLTTCGLLVLLFCLGAIVDRPWISEALKILGTAFTFTAGVAIGKASGKK